MSAVYIALASLHYSQRVPQPSQQTLKHLAVAFARKGKVGRMDSGSKRAVGLIENRRYALFTAVLIRNCTILSALSAAETE
eukprot:345315-Pleurochrysis_carterae.AAC.1